MLDRPEDRRPPITPQLAWRVAILGGVAFALFAIIFFRLWFLQVLSGDQYLAKANSNRARDLVVAAPRGAILDRNGTVLVDNHLGLSTQIDPSKLPAGAAAQDDLYRRLGKVLRLRPRAIRHQVITQRKLVPYANVTIKTDTPQDAFLYIQERQNEFPGVLPQQIYLRRYPHRELAAQLFGTVGQISPKEIKQARRGSNDRFRGVRQGTVVGQAGIEYTYDRYLRGIPGVQRVEVNAFGEPASNALPATTMPRQGNTLRLSIDTQLQQAGQQAILDAQGQSSGTAGAFVALDPRNGAVLAMGSEPSFDPNVFSKPISQSTYTRLFNSDASGHPLFNRAVAGLYPTGSTFKPITATAALQSGSLSPDETIDDTGTFKSGVQVFKNAGGAVNGVIALRQALQVSSDVFFYTLGARMNTQDPQGGALQQWARRFGIGRTTGIDLVGDSKGTLPTPRWRTQLNETEVRCAKRHHGRSCGIADGRPWSVGDNINLAVGQGDLQASPLQMAVAYAALENGGRIVRPHLGLDVEDSSGRQLQSIEPGSSRRITINPANRQAILDGLHLAASAAGGTSADVWRGWNQARYPIFGKTGTAERPPFQDQSWYVAFVPDKSRPIVVAATIEQGGFGAAAAAPAVRQIISQWYYGRSGSFISGTSTTR